MSITISLCMIVKNEEKFIRRCILSAMPLVSEAIIVDTGSTDKTIEIIKSFREEFDMDIKIIETTWENNFAKARNLSIKDAKGDWILILDADEMIECNIELLKQFLETMDETMWTIPIINYADKGAPAVSTVMHRLYQNKDVSYIGEIHERILQNGENKIGTVMPERVAKIHHVGYKTEVVKQKNKGQRNLKIIREQIKKEPNVSFHRFNLGKTYMQQRKYDKALDAFIKWSKCTDSHYYEQIEAGYSVALCLLNLKRYDDAQDYLIKLKKNETFTNQPKLYNLWAELYEKQKKYKQSFICHHRALICGLLDVDKSGVKDEGIGSYYTVLLAAITYQEIKDDRTIYYYINGIFHKENDILIGRQQFMDFVENDDRYKKYAQIFSDEIEHILSGEELILKEKYSDNELIENEKNIVKTLKKSIESGDLDQAKAIVQECDEVLGHYPMIYSFKGVIAMMNKDNILASLYFVLAERYFPEDFDSIYNLAFLYESVGIGELSAIYYYIASRHADCPLSELEYLHNKVDEYKDQFSWFEID